MRLCRAVLCRNATLLGRQNMETESMELRGEDTVYRVAEAAGGGRPGSL